MRIDDLMAQVTEEDGLTAEFLGAVRTAYDEDWAESLGAITTSHESAVAEIQTGHETELAATKAAFFDKIMSGEGVTDTSLDDNPIVDSDDEDNEPLYKEA